MVRTAVGDAVRAGPAVNNGRFGGRTQDVRRMEEASVAGESPDRSKQRESSGEPTSGSAGAVPDTRDPRLAVARASESHGGGADTATKVLSTREASTDADHTTETGKPTHAGPRPGTGNTDGTESHRTGARSGSAETAGTEGRAGAGSRSVETAGTESRAGAGNTAETKSRAGAGNTAETKSRAGAGNTDEAESRRAGARTGSAETDGTKAEAAARANRAAEAGDTGETESRRAGAQTGSAETDGTKGRVGAGNTAETKSRAGAGNTAEAAARANRAAEAGDTGGTQASVQDGVGPETDGTGARLAAAVAAWVRSGDSGDSDGAETAGAPSKPLPGAAEPRPEGSAGSKAPSASGTGPEDAVHTPDPETAPEAAAAQQTDAAADTNTAPAGDTGSKAADPKADASREADTDPKAGASREADSGPKTAAGSTTAAGSQTDANPKAGAGHDADAGPKTGADPTTAADPQTDANPKAGAGHDADTDPKTAADPTTAADPQTDAGPKAGAGHDADAGPKTAADPQTDAGPKAGAGREAGGGVGTGAEAGGAATAEAEAAVIATHSVSGTRTDDETEAGTEDATGVDAPRASGAKAGADSAARAHDAVAADAASDSAGDGAKTDAEAGHGSASGAGAQADADAEGDAGVGGSRDAGGPGGRRSDDAGGGHGAGAQGVDQPTAVFKAVRVPADAPVDQPTTMLKLGGAGKPGTSETDAERTSRFVALKPLDDPATRRPPAAPADATARVPRLGPERTTQQPLPPKPPLDLLAELTNTPPPPQTPVRTIVRRVKIWTPLVVLLAVVFAVVQALRPLPTPSLDLTAEESYTFDGGKASIPWPSGGQGALEVQGIGSFGSSGEQKPVPIASVAKVMTAYLILRDHPLKGGEGPKIPVDQTAQDQATADGESTVEVRAGDTITEREALEGVLIASANNVARLLARWDAGSEKAFVAKMNAAAKDLGMTHTTYTDPSGLEKTTVSTAVDQVKLAKAAMQNASFREVARMMEYTDYKGTKHSNWNRLVGYNDVIGIKTGTTTAAGGNLVFAATREVGGETRTIVGAVVGQGPGGADNTIISGALDAGDKLIRAAQGALKPATILKKGDVVGYVDDGLGGRTPVVITKDVTAVGWAGLKVGLSFAADDVPHSAKAGTKVGTLTVGDGSNGAVKVPVALQKDLAEPGFTDKLTRLG